MNQVTSRQPRNLQHLLQAIEPRPLKGRVIARPARSSMQPHPMWRWASFAG